MKQTFRTSLLVSASALMLFGAVGYTAVVLPDLRGDLIEIGVRQTVLGGTLLHLYFAAMAMFGFAMMALSAAVQSIRGVVPARIPLGVIAVIHTGFGVLAFSRSHNPHHLGPVAMGLLLAAALVIPAGPERGSLT